MRPVIASLVFLSLAAAGPAFAQDAPADQGKGAVKIGKPKGVKLAKAECEATWAKANPAKKDKITAGQAQPFIADVMGANSNGDGSIDQTEFMAACDKGLMRDSSATTGGSAGTEGSGTTAAPAAPKTPEAAQ